MARADDEEEDLLKYSTALTTRAPKAFPPLRMAVMQQNVSAALVMMACGAAPIWLHDAVRVGSLDLVQALLHFNADPAKQDGHEFTRRPSDFHPCHLGSHSISMDFYGNQWISMDFLRFSFCFLGPKGWRQDSNGASSIDTAVQICADMQIVEVLRENVHLNGPPTQRTSDRAWESRAKTSSNE